MNLDDLHTFALKHSLGYKLEWEGYFEITWIDGVSGENYWCGQAHTLAEAIKFAVDYWQKSLKDSEIWLAQQK